MTFGRLRKRVYLLHRKRPSLGSLLQGAAILYLLAMVVLPFLALGSKSLEEGPRGFWNALADPVAKNALILTLWTAAIMAVVNAIAGTATAWVLVRYRFPGRALLTALVDLPFAIPTLVAGILIVLLYGPQASVGAWFVAHDWKIAFAPPGIVLALLFTTVPFVVRAVEPVLLELDPAEEEAAAVLGCGAFGTFRKIVLPALFPAILSGTMQSFARSLGEFGSVVVVAGNIPHRTLTAPVHVFSEIESGNAQAAAAVSIALFALALALEPLSRTLGRRLIGGNRV